MENINSHLETYLDFYLKPSIKKNYAVLIDGAWGIGKTFFIKSFISHAARKDFKFIYVSLNGVSHSSEIEDQIFQTLHPILSNKYLSLATKAAKSAIKLGLKIDLDGVRTGSDAAANVSLPTIDFKEFSTVGGNCVLIFDDLERCQIPISQVLGYINHFCEHDDLKVIILANEGDILTKSKEYPDIKEKLIGRTFSIKSNAENALMTFINSLEEGKPKEYLYTNKDILLSIYETSTYKNLRSLRQVVLEWPQLYFTLTDDAKKNNELLQEVIRTLLILSFEIRKGELLVDYLSAARGDQKKDTVIKNLENKYSGFIFNELCPSLDCWFSFFKEGAISKELLEKSIVSSKFFVNVQTPDWKKLLHFNDLETEEFYRLNTQVWDNFKLSTYKRVGEILHVVSSRLFFANNGIISESIDDIISISKQIVLRMNTEKTLVFESGSTEGYAYSSVIFLSRDSKDFRDFCSFLENLEKAAIEAGYPNVAKHLIRLIHQESYQFWKALSEKAVENKIHDSAVLSHINPKEFVEAFFACPNSDKRYVSYGLKDRYQHMGVYRELLKERSWLTEVRRLFVEESLKQPTLTKYHSNWTLQYAIDPILKSMNDIFAVEESSKGAPK